MLSFRNNPHFLLLSVIAITLSIMSTVTPLWVKQGKEILICSALETKSIYIDENGKELPPKPKLKKACKNCLVSAGLAFTPQTPDFTTTPPLNKEYSIHLGFFTDVKEPLKPRVNPPRAPPKFS